MVETVPPQLQPTLGLTPQPLQQPSRLAWQFLVRSHGVVREHRSGDDKKGAYSTQ
jgi:hypothetical protein